MERNVPDKLARVNRRPPREGLVRIRTSGRIVAIAVLTSVLFARAIAADVPDVSAVSHGDWRAGLDAALSADALRGAALSVYVVERDTGAVLYERSPGRALLV